MNKETIYYVPYSTDEEKRRATILRDDLYTLCPNAEHVSIYPSVSEATVVVEEVAQDNYTFINLNVVTCGHCGEAFAHKLRVDELTCPYCKYTSDICDFPDLAYSPDSKDSLITFDK